MYSKLALKTRARSSGGLAPVSCAISVVKITMSELPNRTVFLNACFTGSNHWHECREVVLSPAKQTNMQSAAKVRNPPFVAELNAQV